MTLTKESPARVRGMLARAREQENVRLVLRALAAVSMVVLAMGITLPQGVKLGYLVAAAIVPLWIHLIHRFRFGWFVFATGILALGAGVWLEMANSGLRSTNPAVLTSSNILLIGSILTIGLVIWARTVLSDSAVAFWFGIGLVLSIDPSTALFHSNPWKFGFYLPIAIASLALARLTRRWWVELLVLLTLTGISAFTDARSAFGLLLLAAVLLIAQLPVLRAGHKGSPFLVFLGVVGISVVVWIVGQAAILGGYLGSATQARSIAQIQASGSLILGGRPELAATLALMNNNPWGYGVGVAPNPNDLLVAKAGMTAIGYSPENQYVNTYMFGGHFELHSTFGDLWAQSGVAGLLFVAVVLFFLLWSVSRRIADGTASGVVLFAVGTSVWLTLFGPWQSTAPYLVLAIGLVAVPHLRKGRPSVVVGDAPRHQFRVNSKTESIGPVQRFVSRRPSRANTEASAAAADAG